MLNNFDLQWLLELFHHSRGWPVVLLAPLAALAAGLYVLLSTFLAGGALTIFAPAECAYQPAVFYQGCGRNFARLFRLLLYSLVFYALVLALNAGLLALGHRLFRDSMVERPVAIYSWCRAAIVLALLAAVNLIFDYAKIRLVVDDSRKSLRAAFGPFAAVARHLGSASAAYLLVALMALALAAAWAGLCALLPGSALLWLLLAVLLQQLFVLSRIWVRLLFFSTQTRLYQSWKPPAPPSGLLGAEGAEN